MSVSTSLDSTGGERLIPIETPRGTFNVWTERHGYNPEIKLLLLHGGPGCTHEYFEVFDDYLPQAGIEYYYYDQLGSGRSDQPDAPELWDLPRFVEEVEQVRQALGLDAGNFFVLGHSWGGILAMEYALKYQRHLKGLVISNMMSSFPAYNRYARDVLKPQMPPDVVTEIEALEAAGDWAKPRYMELLIPHHYEQHVLRRPHDEWPDCVVRAFAHTNPDIYVPMQGPSELGGSGKLADWDRSGDLGQIAVQTLVVSAKHDTMDPKHMRSMARSVQAGRHLYCPNGSHMAMHDDTQTYVSGLVDFLYDVADFAARR